MKKAIAAILLLCLVILCGCSKPANMTNVSIDYGKSKVYSRQDMDSAISVIKKEFSKFEGCELHSISFTSDGICKDNVGYCNTLREGAGLDKSIVFDESIVFESSFHTPKYGSDGFNPNEEYDGWNWVLARQDNGAWKLLTWGYA